MIPATLLPPNWHAGCGKPKTVPREAFRNWFMQTPRSGPFVPMRKFLSAYCTCPRQEA